MLEDRGVIGDEDENDERRRKSHDREDEATEAAT